MPLATLRPLTRRLTLCLLLAGSLTSLSAQSKEYIRLGGRVIAIDSPNELRIQSPARTMVGAGESVQFTALINGTVAAQGAVTWSATTGQITNGLYQAPSSFALNSSGQGPTVTITATTTGSPSQSNTATLTLMPVLNHTRQSFAKDGGDDTIKVTKDGTWTIANKPTWVTIDGNLSRAGNDDVKFTVIPCGEGCTTTRTATMQIAGVDFVVEQTPEVVEITINPVSQTVDPPGRTGLSVTVNSSSSTAHWSAAKEGTADWVTNLTTTYNSGTGGSGTVTYNVASIGTDVNPRTATLLIAGQKHTIYQQGVAPHLDASAVPASVPCEGSSPNDPSGYPVYVYAPTGASWTAAPSGNESWITITYITTSGVTTGFRFTVDPNNSAARQATINISGLSVPLAVSISQEAQPLVKPAYVALREGAETYFRSYLSGSDDTTLATWDLIPSTGQGPNGGGWLESYDPVLGLPYKAPSSQAHRTVTVRATRTIGGVERSGEATVELWPTVMFAKEYQANPKSSSPAPGVFQKFYILMNNLTSTELASDVHIRFAPAAGTYQGTCAVRVSSLSNKVLALYTDSYEGPTVPSGGSLPAGDPSAGTVSNSQCTIDAAQSLVDTSGVSGSTPAVWITLAVRFTPSFQGSKTLYLSLNYGGTPWLPETPLATVTVPGYQPPSIAIEQPAEGSIIAGSVNVSGWALDNTAQIEANHSVTGVSVSRVQGQTVTALGPATYGSLNRADICALYPDRGGCPNVGFSYTWDTSSVTPGQYTIRAMATDNDSSPRSTTVERQVTVGRAVTITTNPVGLPIYVDGVAYTSPRTFAWAVDSNHTVSAADYENSGTRYTFQSWSDSGTRTHGITTTSSTTQTYTATFALKHKFTLAVSPEGAGSITTNVPSTDGYYLGWIGITAVPNSDYYFDHWSGDTTGTTNPQATLLDGPRTVTAHFVRHPAVTLSTNPAANLSIVADGIAYPAPRTFYWPANSTHTISTATQLLSDTRYTFIQWSNAGLGTQSQTITVPSGGLSLTATFTPEYLPLDQFLNSLTLTTGGGTYKARHSIVAQGNVSITGTARVTFTAGTQIRLGQGFHAKAEGTETAFSAAIDTALR